MCVSTKIKTGGFFDPPPVYTLSRATVENKVRIEEWMLSGWIQTQLTYYFGWLSSLLTKIKESAGFGKECTDILLANLT